MADTLGYRGKAEAAEQKEAAEQILARITTADVSTVPQKHQGQIDRTRGIATAPGAHS
jgi:hypothetical protein